MDIKWGDLCCPFSSKWMWICGLFLSIARIVVVIQAAATAAAANLKNIQRQQQTSWTTSTFFAYLLACSHLIFLFEAHGPCTLATYALWLYIQFALVCWDLWNYPHSRFVTHSIDRTNYTDWECENPSKANNLVGWVFRLCVCVFLFIRVKVFC